MSCKCMFQTVMKAHCYPVQNKFHFRNTLLYAIFQNANFIGVKTYIYLNVRWQLGICSLFHAGLFG